MQKTSSTSCIVLGSCQVRRLQRLESSFSCLAVSRLDFHGESYAILPLTINSEHNILSLCTLINVPKSVNLFLDNPYMKLYKVNFNVVRICDVANQWK